MANGPPYVDDKSIADTTELFRRINPEQIVQDDNTGERRPSSAAFNDSSDESPMSVALGDTLQAAGRSPESTIASYPAWGLVAITARVARDCEQAIVRDPVPEEPAHGLVAGKKTGGRKNTFKRAARWVVLPP